MFAIALHDRARGQLFLARDHVGIKPLYYAHGAHGLVFGSEVKVLLASGRVQRRLCVDSLGQFLAWEYVPGTRTLLRDVQRLGSGQSALYDVASGALRLRDYFSPLDGRGQPQARSDAEWEEELDAAVRRCVQRQLVSDVALGAFLSGGVDSSLVVAAMGEARTFSIGFDDPSYNETRWSSRVADHLGVKHQIEVIEPRVLDLFDPLMHHMDDPIGDFSIFPTYLVSRLARQHVTVALSGDGGDELFGGYETYLAQEKSATWAFVPRALRAGVIDPLLDALPPSAAKKGLVNKAKRFSEGARLDPAWGHARWRVFCEEGMRQQLFTAQARAALTTPVGAHITALRQESSALDARDQALYVDFRSYLVENCLAKVDRMSMACSLEVRVPLLDRELVELAYRLPSRLKFDGSSTKILLKRVAARHVPRECVYRPKEGFSIPIKNWLRGELRGLVEQYLAPERLRQQGLLEAQTVTRLWREHLENRANHSHLLWSLLVFEQWLERWGVSA
jgi:asparagine synthase (glutamine-hydrolysing)